MNKQKKAIYKTDKRSLRSRRALTEALLTLLEKQKFQNITVNDICLKAQVSRPTFYAYFSDKHALLRFSLAQFFDKIVARAAVGGGSNRDFMRAALDKFEKRYQTFQTLLSEETGRLLLDIIHKAFYRFHYAALSETEEKGHVYTVPKALASTFRAGGCVFLITQWINAGLQIPKDELLEYLLLLNGSTESIITHL